MAVEERIVEHGRGIGTACACREQGGDGGVSFAVERGKEVDEQGQHDAAQCQTASSVAYAAKHLLEGIHHTGKIERDEAAAHAQQHGTWHAVHYERVGEREGEHGRSAVEGVGDAGGREATHQQGQQGGHGEVDHEHLEREHEARNGCLEDAGYGPRSTATDEQHEHFVVELEHAAQVAADGRACKHNGRLSSHRTAAAYGQRRGNDARPAVVRPYLSALARQGVENFCHAVANVVAHHIADEERREQDAHHGIDQEEPVGVAHVEL